MIINTWKNGLYAAGRHLVLGGLCILFVFPIFWALLTSLKPANEVFSPGLSGRYLTLANYMDVFSILPIGSMLMNSLLMALLVTLGVVLVSIGAAYALMRWHFRGKNVLFLLFVGALLVPAQVTIIPNYLTLAQLGWLNTLPGLVIPQLATGLGIFYLRQQFNNFPRELLDAGVIDGAGSLRMLWSVILPNMRSVLTALAIILFIQTWNEYFWPLLVSSDLHNTTIQVGLQVFLQEDSNAWGALMAAAMMSLLPVLVLYALAQRQIIAAFVRSGIQ